MTRRLLLLNGIAVICAVANHAVGWAYTSLFWWTDRYAPVAVPDFSQLGSPTYFGLRVIEQVVTFSLPAFLFVSGFFVAFAAGRAATGLGWSKVKGRLRMLLAPYLVWSVAIMLGRLVEGSTDTAAGYLEQLLFGRAAEPYYYIPLVTQLYLLAPLIVVWVKAHWKSALLVAGLLQISVQAASYVVLVGWKHPAAIWVLRHAPNWLFVQMVFWFVFGVFAGLHSTIFSRWLSALRPLLPWATVAIGVAGIVEWEAILRSSGKDWLTPSQTVLDTLYDGAFIMTFMAFAQANVPFKRQLDGLGERSFGVYLIHAPVLELFSRASYHLAPVLLGHQLLLLSVLVVAGVGVPLCLMASVNRSPARPLYNYLFG